MAYVLGLSALPVKCESAHVCRRFFKVWRCMRSDWCPDIIKKNNPKASADPKIIQAQTSDPK